MLFVDSSMSGTPKEGDLVAGKYRVERVLGEGGMGVVVAAYRTDLEQKVAIKVLNAAALKNPDILQRFEREARAAVKIQSRHVARVSDVGKLEDGAPFIVMEFLEGRDLSHLLEDGLPTIERSVDFVLQACDAIAEAHAYGIVHRDLKPGNLFLANQPDGSVELKVLDFGISKSVGPDKDETGKSLTKTTDVFGSPMYMSPEQLLSTATVDQRTDIWALGIILYELLTGEPPFHMGSVAEIWAAILEKQIPLPSHRRADLPRDIEDVVMKCLSRNIDLRYQTIGDLAEDLAPFGSGDAKACVERAKRFKKGRFVPDPAPSSPGSTTVPMAPHARGSSPGSSARPNVPDAAPSSPGPTGLVAIPKAARSSSGEKPKLQLESDTPEPIDIVRSQPTREARRARSTSAGLTSTDWQTHEMASSSRGGMFVTILIVGVLGAVAATAYYVRTHVAPAEVSRSPSSVPTLSMASAAAPAPVAPSASAAPTASAEPVLSAAAPTPKPRGSRPAKHVELPTAKPMTPEPDPSPVEPAKPVPTASPETPAPAPPPVAPPPEP